MGTWAERAVRAERWLLPPECLVCGSPAISAGEPLVCDVCRARWRPIPPPICSTCGEPQPLGLACRLCAEWMPDLTPVRSAVRLDADVRHAVHRFKYLGWWRLAESFALRMAPLVRDMGDADLVPVPLAPRRLRARGFNQAERLAVAVGAITGLPVRPQRLQRVRETPSQTRLTPEGRRANVAAAFRGREGRRPAILVDDVFTTGATLCSAALALAEAGAPKIAGVTFARAELPLAALAGGS